MEGGERIAISANRGSTLMSHHQLHERSSSQCGSSGLSLSEAGMGSFAPIPSRRPLPIGPQPATDRDLLVDCELMRDGTMSVEADHQYRGSELDRIHVGLPRR